MPHKYLLALMGLWAFGVFVFDLVMPLGFAGGVPYVVLVLLSLFSPRQRLAYPIAGISSCLTVLGYFLSPVGGIPWVVLMNRGLALGVIWLTAVLVDRYRFATQAGRLAEEALRESEARLKTITEKALDAMVMVDHEGRILYWNAASKSMFGYSAEEALGKALPGLIASENNRGFLEEGFRELHQKGAGRLIGKAFELHAVKKDGTKLAVEHAFSAVKIGGKWGAVGIMRDITRRKEEVETQFSQLNTAHQRIVQVEKLSAMGLMVGEIAHQINNPLVGVINMAQLALREEGLSEDTREFLEDIRDAGEDCRGFLQRMLDFSKTSRFHRKPTVLGELIEETLLLCQQSLGKPSDVRSEFPKQSVVLQIDPVLMRHALFNLVTNAMQSAEGAAICVRLSAQNRNEAPGWALSVRDWGPGLPDAIMGKIFAPFFTTRPKGTGLGLALVEHVAILHGGEVKASNPIGGGAQFTIWLPEASPEASQGVGSC